jgi:periplasmic protein TonB
MMFVRMTCVAAALLALVANPAFGQLPQADREYAKLVHSLLLKEARYPNKAAWPRRPEGSAVVFFSVAADGRITSRRILRSSGHAVLDQAALATVERVGRLPSPPANLKNKNFALPIHFRRAGLRQLQLDH